MRQNSFNKYFDGQSEDHRDKKAHVSENWRSIQPNYFAIDTSILRKEVAIYIKNLKITKIPHYPSKVKYVFFFPFTKQVVLYLMQEGTTL